MPSARLNISESFEVPVDEQSVWELISDPVRVVPCMPGASLGEVGDDGSIAGSIVANLGPVKVWFSGTVTPEYDHDNHRGTLLAKGADTGGRTRASATTEFRLATVDENRTSVSVESTLDVSGGLAPFVQTGGVHLVRTMLSEFSDNLTALAVGTAPTEETSSGATAAPVSAPPPRKIRGIRLGARVTWLVFRDAIKGLWRRLLRRPSDNNSQHEDRSTS